MSEESERRDKLEAGWPMRALRHLGANRTMLGTALIAMLSDGNARINKTGPSFGPTAAIDTEGRLWSQYLAGPASEPSLVDLGPVPDMLGSLNRLADELGFLDGERIALFETFKRWVAYDGRAIADVKL